MTKQKYSLNQGERIIFKEGLIRYGFWGSYTNTLVVTNQAVIFEQYGTFNNFKGIIRYPLSEINQAIIGKAPTGENQLELYFNNKTEKFVPQSDDDTLLKTLVMAINDQLSTDADYYDYSYYQTILDRSDATVKELKNYTSSSKNAKDSEVQSGIIFAGNVAKNILKSGDLSLKGVQKGINKATNKEIKKRIFGDFKEEVKDEVGVQEFQDSLTEVGNEFRAVFGLKPKITHRERREKVENEQKQLKREAYNRHVNKAQQELNSRKASSVTRDSNSKKKEEKMSINEQLDALRKLKDLLDAGILTQEEFDIKKKEIMNL